MQYPKIYLVIDNCFALKRWVKPSEWMNIIKEIGFNYVEASTDNEIDPLFFHADYMSDWFGEVKECEKITGLKVINFFTGYQTYRTVGLAHYDNRVRRRLIERWFKPIIKHISDLKAEGLGFSFFALPDDVLNDYNKYLNMSEIIIDSLAEISKFAFENGGVKISFEQMYSPHQPPWTINGTLDYLKKVYSKYKNPIYVTIDVGHMVGQKKFLKISKQTIKDNFIYSIRNKKQPQIWLGSDSVCTLWDKLTNSCKNECQIERAVEEINEEMEKYPYLFSDHDDSNIYRWIEELAVYSPIIHMQQTDGVTSTHAAFTQENNRFGLVKGEFLLKSIAKSFYKQKNDNMPPFVEDIYLSFEIFSSNIETKKEIIYKLMETLKYWRKFIPQDGISLEKLL